jgi:hypothetical protein
MGEAVAFFRFSGKPKKVKRRAGIRSMFRRFSTMKF